MSAQTQPAALPPKLRQLLETLPDVDGKRLLAIAHEYRMDLDDPSFLPLLLTQQGISALDKSRADLVGEVDAALNRVAAKIVEASAGEAARLKEYAATLAGCIKKTAADEDERLRDGIAGWACGPLPHEIFSAMDKHLNELLPQVIEGARKEAEQASREFVGAAELARAQAIEAGASACVASAKASAAVRTVGIWQLATAFLGGATVAMLALQILKRFF